MQVENKPLPFFFYIFFPHEVSLNLGKINLMRCSNSKERTARRQNSGSTKAERLLLVLAINFTPRFSVHQATLPCCWQALRKHWSKTNARPQDVWQKGHLYAEQHTLVTTAGVYTCRVLKESGCSVWPCAAGWRAAWGHTRPAGPPLPLHGKTRAQGWVFGSQRPAAAHLCSLPKAAANPNPALLGSVFCCSTVPHFNRCNSLSRKQPPKVPGTSKGYAPAGKQPARPRSATLPSRSGCFKGKALPDRCSVQRAHCRYAPLLAAPEALSLTPSLGAHSDHPATGAAAHARPAGAPTSRRPTDRGNSPGTQSRGRREEF